MQPYLVLPTEDAPGWGASPPSGAASPINPKFREPCLPGTFMQNDWGSTCKPCPAGYFTDGEDQPACQACPLTTYNPSVGANSCLYCSGSEPMIVNENSTLAILGGYNHYSGLNYCQRWAGLEWGGAGFGARWRIVAHACTHTRPCTQGTKTNWTCPHIFQPHTPWHTILVTFYFPYPGNQARTSPCTAHRACSVLCC